LVTIAQPPYFAMTSSAHDIVDFDIHCLMSPRATHRRLSRLKPGAARFDEFWLDEALSR
jgi:hypothetical protein